MERDLHLARLVLDRRELLRIAKRHRLRHGIDEGYLIHAGLSEIFATSSEPANVPLRPFAVDDTYPAAAANPERLYLLAYTELDERAVLARMNDRAGELVRQCATRAIEQGPPAGARLTFRVRICPTVRTKQPGEHELRRDERGRTIARELDAWLASRLPTWTEEPPAIGRPFERSAEEWKDRERVYTAWLAREFGRGDAAALEEGTRMVSFARQAVFRQGEPTVTRNKRMQRPNAVFEGTLRVRDTAAFRALLRRGIGRHRAFGFGMLLVRRA